MAASGYSRTVMGDDGKRYKLPDAEYVASKSIDLNQVRDEVMRIAKTHNHNPAVLVTKSAGRAWFLTIDK
jgi:hypothetical protein